MTEVPIIMEQSRDEWLAERKTCLGGSDSYGVCGLVDQHGRPYFGKTPYSVWLDKTTPHNPEEEQEETDAQGRGTRAEGWLAAEYEHITGRKTRRDLRIRRHAEFPFLGASLDRIVTPEWGSERRLLEIKTSGRRDWWGPDGSGVAGVPEPYLFQVQHYLMVTGYDVADIIVALSVQDVRIYEVEPKRSFIERLKTREIKFWREHVEPRIPPEMVPGDEIIAYPKDDGSTLEIEDEIEVGLVENLVRLKGLKKDLEGKIAELESGVKTWMGKNRYLTIGGELKVDWRTDEPKGKKVDLESIKKKQPELYNQLLKDFGKWPKARRVFVVKMPKATEGDDE